jgi:nucleoside-diphosphate-sugar epimerase
VQITWQKPITRKDEHLKSHSLSQQWKELKDDGRRYPWKDVLLRMIADLASVNASLILAFVLWYVFYVQILHAEQPDELAQRFKHFVTGYALLWSVLALLIFHLHGFYTRTRGYVQRYKAFVVFRAVTLFVCAFVFVDYFLYRGQLFPRGAAFLCWVFLLVTIGGSRLAKYSFLKLYQVERRRPPKRPERVLVVGGAGYLGSALVPILLDRGYRVRVLDSLLFGKEPLKPAENHLNFELIPGDVRDIQAVVRAMKGCDAVIHLAAIVGDPACDENPELAAEINRAATRMLIDVGRGHGIQRFLLASTCSVYGTSKFLMDEYAQVVPISLYARTKLDSERILLEAKSSNFHPTILRLATLFGLSLRPRFDLVVNLLTVRAIRLSKITIFNGEQWRPFMHVYDAARAFVACLEANNLNVVSGEVFNAGSDDMNHRLSEVAARIAKIVPAVEVERLNNEDRRNYRVSFDKIFARLGFMCERSLEDGIREMADMVRRSPVEDFSAEMFNNRAMVRLYAQSPDSKRSSIGMLEALSRAAGAK